MSSRSSGGGTRMETAELEDPGGRSPLISDCRCGSSKKLNAPRCRNPFETLKLLF